MDKLPDAVQPTPENISIVQTNLINLQRFNDVLYSYIIAKCANCFLLLGKNDDNDPGLNIGITLLCGEIIGIGSYFGEIGAVEANYFCALISQAKKNPPSSLLTNFSSYILRIQATSLQADQYIAIDYSNPNDNWYQIRTETVDTPFGKKTMSCCLGQLAAIKVPAETDPKFQDMITTALYSFEQNLWWIVLQQNFQINYFIPPANQVVLYYKKKYSINDMNNFCKNIINKYPASNSTYEITQQRNFVIGKKKDYYIIYQQYLGSPPINQIDQPISDGAANYLFIDSIPNTIINKNGLFTREFIFNYSGIKTIYY